MCNECAVQPAQLRHIGLGHHAAVVVAPLRLARGLQNKVLEAMAMARPAVVAAPCVDALDVVPGQNPATRHPFAPAAPPMPPGSPPVPPPGSSAVKPLPFLSKKH